MSQEETDALENAKKMLEYGADGFSIARAAIQGKLGFKLTEL